MSASRAAYAETEEEAADLVTAILNLRRIKCRIYADHTEDGKCKACGL